MQFGLLLFFASAEGKLLEKDFSLFQADLLCNKKKKKFPLELFSI